MAHCTQTGIEKVKRFQHESYWGKPVPGFGSETPKLWILGLAPAAHGANRTGRMFTGDRSGEWLYKVLFDHGFSSADSSRHLKDGLKLKYTYISALLRCAPPGNLPRPDELENCREFWLEDWHRFKPRLQCLILLGKMAYDAFMRQILKPHHPHAYHLHKSPFRHGNQFKLENILVLASFHPSQQNTFTRKLTWPMWNDIFKTASQHIEISAQASLKIDQD